jgi:hypothetical protein
MCAMVLEMCTTDVTFWVDRQLSKDAKVREVIIDREATVSNL